MTDSSCDGSQQLNKGRSSRGNSDVDYTSSSEQSCDTVIYVMKNGRVLSDKELTDNEGPPRTITSLPKVHQSHNLKVDSKTSEIEDKLCHKIYGRLYSSSFARESWYEFKCFRVVRSDETFHIRQSLRIGYGFNKRTSPSENVRNGTNHPDKAPQGTHTKYWGQTPTYR